MDLQKAIKYIPKTQTVNQDRQYFIDGKNFIKIDSNVGRGQREAHFLSSNIHPYIQKHICSYIRDDKHFLETEYFEGETLENLILSTEQKRLVEHQIFDLFSFMVSKQIIHGDINVSNIIFNGKKILLIDWETWSQGDALENLFGPPTPTNHCGILNTIRMVREKYEAYKNR